MARDPYPGSRACVQVRTGQGLVVKPQAGHRMLKAPQAAAAREARPMEVSCLAACLGADQGFTWKPFPQGEWICPKGACPVESSRGKEQGVWSY